MWEAGKAKTNYTAIVRKRSETASNGERTAAEFSQSSRKEVRAQVKYGIIQRYASKYTVISMCRFFDISRSGYYSFRKRSEQLNRESLLVEQIQACRGS